MSLPSEYSRSCYWARPSGSGELRRELLKVPDSIIGFPRFPKNPLQPNVVRMATHKNQGCKWSQKKKKKGNPRQDNEI